MFVKNLKLKLSVPGSSSGACKTTMNPQFTLILAVIAVVFVTFVFMGIWASRYVKVGPNRVLVVSGRQRLLPDGTRVGFRIVRG